MESQRPTPPVLNGSGTRLRGEGTCSRSQNQWQNWDKSPGLLTSRSAFADVSFSNESLGKMSGLKGKMIKTILIIADIYGALKLCATKSWLKDNSEGPTGIQHHLA